MPTSRVWIAVGLLLLSGCADSFNTTRAAPTRIELPDGTVVAGANGWCVDPSFSRAMADTAVVVLGSCAAIGGDASAPQPDVPGVFTVSVEGEAVGAPSPKELEQFFASDTGRAALARNGKPDSIEILETRQSNGRFFLHLKDQNALPGASPTTWRALFDLGGRFVSVTLYGLKDQPIEAKDGLATLEAQVDRLVAANAP